jgi:DNA modification methylase
MEWWAACRRHLADNASAYIWGNAEDLWRLWYSGGLKDLEPLTFRNEIVWAKPVAQGQSASLFRSFPNNTERCFFFMLGEQGFNNNADNYWEGWEPIRLYIETEMKKCGWTIKDLNKITNTQMAGHWVNKSQWQLLTEEHYLKIQKAARDHDAFKRDHDALKRDHDALKRDFYSTRAYFDNAHDNMNEVWEFNKVSGEERHGHATPKPVDMIARAIKSSAPIGGLVLEPFGGSGSTLIAAHQTNRVAYLMELDPHYVDVICARFQKVTGIKPIVEATGREHDFLDV